MFKNPDLSFLFTFFCEGYEYLRKIFLYLFLTNENTFCKHIPNVFVCLQNMSPCKIKKVSVVIAN